MVVTTAKGLWRQSWRMTTNAAAAVAAAAADGDDGDDGFWRQF